MGLPQHIKNFVNLTSQEEQEIGDLFHREEFLKGQLLFQQGDICQHIFFVDKGFARIYRISDSGKEVTAFFLPENTLVTAIDSFYTHKSTKFYCVLLEDSIIYSVNFSNWEEMLNKSHSMSKFLFRSMYELARKLTELLTNVKFQTAKQRYNILLQDYPFIFQRTQLSHIASYLGITAETLSRLRAEK